MFPGYMTFIDLALDEFCNRHWPCEYVHSTTRGRCVNVKAGHQSKGHQLVSGKVLAVGPYTSVFTTENYRDFFRYHVYMNLENLLVKLRAATMAAIHLELERAAEIHKDIVLQSFYRHVSGSKAFISHTSCFSCLIAPPEHALPCGHVLCTPCVQAYGTARGRYTIDMGYCPLHHDDSDGQFRPRWPVVIKPSNAGVRVLSLDGGGVRGIVELMILQEIERSLGPGLPIQAFFDLIVGTSTGGIIALGLGANGWTVQKCILHFESLCREAFTRRGLAIPGIEWIAANFSRYETKPIEQVLKVVFGEHNLFAGPKVDMDDPRVTHRLTKVAVTTTTTAGTAAVLANYNRMEAEEKPPYQFHRSEKPSVEIKTWQAARATSAAPTMFKPFAHDPSGQVYQDGALWYNCPIEVAMRERRLLWPDVAEVHPDVVLSLGTGVNPKARKKLGGRITRFGLFSPARALAKVAIDQVETSLNSEQTWRNFILHNPPPDNVQGRFVRLSLVLEKDPPKMDDVRALEELKDKTMSQFTARRREIKNLADRMIATSFFFVQDGQIAPEVHQDDSITFAGLIMCRFSTRSEEIQSLGESLRTRLKAAYGVNHTRHNPYFVICERGKHQNAKQVILTAESVDRMINSGEFLLDRVDVHLSDSTVETEILFCLGDQPALPAVWYPISGVPRCLMEDSTRGLTIPAYAHFRSLLTISTGNRPKAQTAPHKKSATFDADWAAFEAKKAIWRFSSDDLSSGKDPFELYGSPGYTTPGNVPTDTISKISQRYSTIARSGSNATTSISRFSTPVPRIPGVYLTPDDIGSTLATDQNHNVAEEVDENLSEALLDPESERVRQQMLYLLLGNKGRPPPTHRESVPVKSKATDLADAPTLYIPTIGFENRATRQKNIQEFVSASDQYRLGFSARTKHTPGIFELDGDSSWYAVNRRTTNAMQNADTFFARRSVSQERPPPGTAFLRNVYREGATS
jgi:predicted acylesterase/phospholipase RssA